MSEERDRYLSSLIGWKYTKFKYAPKWVKFGACWEWAIKQEWWGKGFPNHWGSFVIPQEFIQPDCFADAVYEFLKSKEG